MKNYLPGFAALATLAVAMVAGPVMAQDSATTGGSGQDSGSTGNTSTYTSTQQDNGTSKWPLLGLLGLAGLAGLRRPAQVMVSQRKEPNALAH